MTRNKENKQRENKTESGINLEAIDEQLKGFSGPEAIIGRGGLIEQLTKAVLERALRGELPHTPRESNRRKGLRRKARQPTAVTGTAKRRSPAMPGAWKSRCRATGPGASSRS